MEISANCIAVISAAQVYYNETDNLIVIAIDQLNSIRIPLPLLVFGLVSRMNYFTLDNCPIIVGNNS